MQLAVRIRQIVNLHGRAILAEAVGEHAIRCRRSAQGRYSVAGSVDGTNALNVNGLCCRVPHGYLQICERLRFVGAEPVNEIGLTGKA